MERPTKYFVGDEYSGLQNEKIDWITETFPKERYFFKDEGYFTYERYVWFLNDEDELLFRLRWL